MTIRTHQNLMHLVFLLGVLVCMAGLAFAVWCAGVLGLPRPGGEGAAGTVMGLLVLLLFFAAVHQGGLLAVRLAQRWVRARCPRCAQAAMIVVIPTGEECGDYRCGACGYVHRGRTAGQPERDRAEPGAEPDRRGIR